MNTIAAIAVLLFSMGAHLGPAPSPFAATGCDAALWSHVYRGKYASAQDRLKVLAPCVRVSGTVDAALHEADGDLHIRLHLDPKFQSLINQRNVSGQHGDLVVEPVCVGKATQSDTLAQHACDGYRSKVTVSGLLHKHVTVLGALVQDVEHGGWDELHPVTSITVDGGRK